MNFITTVLYDLKKTVRDKGFLFWVLLYPILLASLFYFTFSNLKNTVRPINVSIEDGNGFSSIAKNIDILNVSSYTENQSLKDLKDEKIDAIVDKALNITIKKQGLNSSILNEIINTTKQMTYLRMVPKGNSVTSNVLEEKPLKQNPWQIPFYSLIAMVSLYGVFGGLDMVNQLDANQSSVGVRIGTSPLKKGKLITSFTIVNILINFMANVLLILFIMFVLKYKIIENLPLTLLIVFIANIIGNSLGILIGSYLKVSMKAKNNFTVVILLLGGALTGMMSPDIKVMMEAKFPMFKLIDPQSIITSELYKINQLHRFTTLNQSLITLLTISVILLLLSLYALRRKNYDSI